MLIGLKLSFIYLYKIILVAILMSIFTLLSTNVLANPIQDVESKAITKLPVNEHASSTHPEDSTKLSGDQRTTTPPPPLPKKDNAPKDIVVDTGSRSLTIPKTSIPPKLEDYLNGNRREDEVEIDDFRQYQPDDGTKVSQKTSAYLSYDEKNLYVIFVCKDEPGKVRANLTKREDFFNTEVVRGSSISDDFVSVNIDTFLDRRRAYVLISNPLGIQRDGIYTVGRGTDVSFDAVWESEGRLTPDGYIVRFSIPFKSLRFPNTPTQRWGIALGRIISRNNEITFWPYITRRVEGLVQQCATLEGLKNISPGRNIQFIPYGVIGGGRFLDTSINRNPDFRKNRDMRAGVDGKFVFRDSITLDVTINPDFSQVESDEPQVTVNERFEVFFPEKRPFFLENAGYFQRDDVHGGLNLVNPRRGNLFFSRRILDPQIGARLTGKAGKWTFGGLAIDDQAQGEEYSKDDALYGKRAVIGVFRLQREYAKQSNIGILTTTRDFASSSNRVLSIDMRHKINKQWVFNGQAAQSFTRSLNGTRLAGPSFLAELYHTGDKLTYTSRYIDRSPEFYTALGFINRVDMRQIENNFNYRWRLKKHLVQNYGPSATALINWDRKNRVQDWVINPSFAIDLKRQTVIRVGRTEAYERFKDIGFRRDNTNVGFATQWLKWLSFSGTYEQGKSINYFPASGLLPFSAHSTDSRIGFTLRPAPKFRFEQSYIYNRLRTREGFSPLVDSKQASIFNNHIFRSKINYQFSKELSLRAILDYNAVLPNDSLVDLDRQKRLFPDLLLTYYVRPGTALYIGYSDRYENLKIDPITRSELQRTISPSISTGRQFFIKMSYLLRY
jgi:hypothetical protein